MHLRIESRWVGLRRNAIEKAEEIACLTSKELPTRLGAIAARQCVKAIEFRPLLADGGIALTEKGFTIYVRAEADEAEHLTVQFEQDGTGIGLPRRMIRRARFTIAHEIAHTFFYDVHSRPPKPKIELKSATSLRSLERVCNAVAGVLLLPEALLEKGFPNKDLAQPAELSKLADAALISKHALVRRLHELQRFPHPIAIIACVRWKGDGRSEIQSVSRHYSLRQVRTSAKEGSSLDSLVDHPDFLPNGGELPEVDVDLCGPAGTTKMRFLCDEPYRPNGRGSFFVTAIRID